MADGSELSGRNKASFEAAGDTCKTLLTLTTGILALTISFATSVAKGATTNELWLLRASWALFLLSAIFGVFTLQGLTGSLNPIPKPSQATVDQPSVYDSNIAGPARKQNVTFLLGVVLFLVFGMLSVAVPKSQPTVQLVCSHSSSTCTVRK